MESSYSQMCLVNVCYCLGKAKWLLYILLRSRLNVLAADELKEGGKERKKLLETGEGDERER